MKQEYLSFKGIIAAMIILSLVVGVRPVEAYAGLLEAVNTWTDMQPAFDSVDDFGTIEVAADLIANTEAILTGKTVSLVASGGPRTISTTMFSPEISVDSSASLALGDSPDTLIFDGTVGHSIIQNSGTLTLKNTVIKNNSSGADHSSPAIRNSGTLIIEDEARLFDNVGGAGNVVNEGELIVNGGITNSFFVIYPDGTVILNGGLSYGTFIVQDDLFALRSEPYYIGSSLTCDVEIREMGILPDGTIIFSPANGYVITEDDLSRVSVSNSNLILYNGNIVVGAFVPPVYTFLHDELKFTKGGSNLINTLSADISVVSSLELSDGTDLLADGYCSLEPSQTGGTDVILTSEWMQSLALGTHKIKASFSDGASSVEMNLVVLGNPKPPGDPKVSETTSLAKTSDYPLMFAAVFLCITSLLIALVSLKRRVYKKEEHQG